MGRRAACPDAWVCPDTLLQWRFEWPRPVQSLHNPLFDSWYGYLSYQQFVDVGDTYFIDYHQVPSPKILKTRINSHSAPPRFAVDSVLRT